MIKRIGFTVLAVLALSVAAQSQTQPQKSTLKDFNEMCALLEGRWAVDVTWIHNWAGANAVQGETAKGYEKFERILDGSALRMTGMEGAQEVSELFYYDAAASLIKSVRVGSGGSYYQSTHWKISKTQYEIQIGAHSGERNGAVISGNVTREFSTDGRSFMMKSKTLKLGGKQLGELKDAHKKVSP